MDYAEMSAEELIKIITDLQTDNDNLTAERDSLAEENSALNEQITASQADLKETKKLNYTLARQLDHKQNEASFEETMVELFGSRKKGV